MCMSASEGCINIYSYGCICVHCGCCKENNPNVIDRVEKQIKYYKMRLDESITFSDFSDNKAIAKVQKKNIESNKKFYKEKIESLEQSLELLKEYRDESSRCRQT